MNQQSTKPKLLYLVHCYHNRAGVEEHVKTLSRALHDLYRIDIAFPEDGRLWLRRGDGERLSWPADRLNILAPYHAPQTENALAQILNLVDPDLVHIVHFANWPLAVIDQVAASGKPFVMSFHDYFAITPYFTMQGEKDPSQTLTPAYALRCFGKDLSPYLIQRRDLLRKGLSRAKGLAVPSPYLARMLGGVFPCGFQVIEYGIDPFEVKPAKKDWPELRFGYLGALLPQKGWEPLLQAYLRIQTRIPHCRLRFYGGELQTPQPLPGVSFHGVFEQADLPEILSQINVGVIPSVFAETYSLVLSEMWQAKLPAAVSDIGAMGERVSDKVNGRKFIPGDIESIAEILLWFASRDAWKIWPLPPVRLAAEMAKEYDDFYQKALKA